MWKRLKRVGKYGSLALLVVLVIAAAVEPFGIVPGFLRGEKFHNYRLTGYWRKRFAAGWQDGQPDEKTVLDFWHFKLDGSPVLIDLLADPDVNVRRIAAHILVIDGRANPATVAALRTALADGDAFVRQYAADAIGRRRAATAMEAVPDLDRLTGDTDPAVRHCAEVALWLIVPDRQAEAQKWVPFRSDKWGFTARFPVRPTESTHPGRWLGRDKTYTRFTAKVGTRIFLVEVSDDPDAPDEPGDPGPQLVGDEQAPIYRDYLGRANLSGRGELWSAPTGEGFMVMTESGSHPKRGRIEALTVTAGKRTFVVAALDSAREVAKLPANIGALE